MTKVKGKKLDNPLQNLSVPFLLNIVNHLPTPVFVQNRYHEWVFGNPSFCQLIGYEATEILGKSEQDIFSSELANLFWENSEIVFRSSEEKQYEIPIIDAEKQTHLITVKLQLLQDEFGYPLLMGTLEKTESLPEKSLLQRVLDTIPQAIFWKDRNSTYLGCNQAFTQVVGVADSSHVIGKQDFDLVKNLEEAQSFRDCDRHVMETNTPSYNIIEPQTTAEGNQRWLETHKVPLRDDQGQVIGVVGTFRDITESKQVEDALRHSEATNHALIKAIPDLLIQMREDGTYLKVVSEGEFKPFDPIRTQSGANIYDILPFNIAQKRMDYTQQALQTGQLQIYEQEFIIHGKTHYEEVRIIPSEDDEVLVIIRDVTDRKEAEIALQKLNEELEKKVEERTAQLRQAIANSKREIRDRQEIEKTLRERDRLLKGVAVASNHLLTIDDFDQSINSALAVLGTAVNVDRTYVFKNHPHPVRGDIAASHQWEWVRSSVSPLINNPKYQNIPYHPLFTSWYNALSQRQPIAQLVTDCPSSMRDFLEPQGIRSVLIMPLEINQQFWGFIGFDDCHGDRLWSESEQSILQAFASSLSGAIARHQFEAQLHTINTCAPGILYQYQTHLATGKSLFSYISPKCLDLFELEASVLLTSSDPLWNLIHPDDLARLQASTQSAIEHQTSWLDEFRIITPSGQEKWIQGRSEPSQAPPGFSFHNGIFVDITERKQIENTLRLAQYAIDHAGDTIFWIQPDARIAYANQAACQILGYSLAELLSQSVFDVDVDFSPSIWSEHWKTLKQRGNLVFESRHRAKDGRIFPVELSVNHVEFDKQEYIFAQAREISDRKQAETELLETRNFLETILENLPVAVITKEAQALRFVLWNHAASELIGYQSQEVIGKNDYDFFPPEQADFFVAKDREVLASHQTLEISEELVQNSQGETRILRTKKTPLFKPNGEPQYLLLIIEDITNRRMAEIALRESEQRFRDVSEAAGEYIWEVDQNGIYTFITDKAEQVKGYSASELLGHSPFDFMPVEDRVSVQAILEDAYNRKGSFTLEHRNITPSGKVIWEQVSGLPLLNEQGEIIGFRGAGLSITERKLAEAALARQARLADFRAEVDFALTHGDSLPLILNRCTTAIVNHLNAAFARIWTLNPLEDILELQASSGLYTHINGSHARVPRGQDKIWLVAQERLPHLTNNILNDPSITDQEWAKREGIVAFAGYPLIVDDQVLGVIAMFAREPLPNATLEALEFAAGEIALGIKRKQAEAALQQSEAQLRQKAQELEAALQELQRTQIQMIQSEKMSSLGQLVAGVAHEINNPVNFIFGNITPASEYIEDLLRLIHLYQRHYPQPNPIIQEEIEAIDLDFLIEDLPKLLSSMRLGADRIRQIVLSLRTFSRLDEADCKEVNIHEGIDSTLIILENRLKAKSERPAIQIIKEYGDLPWVECYAGQLNQVFMNILTNAIDALDERDHRRSFSENQQSPSWIRISTAPVNQNQVLIRITDNGPGIPELIKQRIFDPFFTTKPIGKGTGMGMSISYQIITENHRGSLHCISEPGKGAEFVITIPVKQSRFA